MKDNLKELVNKEIEIYVAEDRDDGEIYMAVGNDKWAVLSVFGYSTGTNPGQHTWGDYFASAELGVMVDGEFDSIDYDETRTRNRAMIGMPYIWSGWDPEDEDDDVISSYQEWAMETAKEMLQIGMAVDIMHGDTEEDKRKFAEEHPDEEYEEPSPKELLNRREDSYRIK